MFTEQKLITYANLLGLTVEELNSFMKRYKNYLLSKEEITKNVLINGLFILEEITTDKWAEEANKKTYKSKNLIIHKYMDEIIELYKQGMGTIKLSSYLYITHRVKISRSSLDIFISSNNIKRS
ncbi:hypothetical protein [Sulfurimonas sp.]|uniref:hypothetical protein n=1 Tax=Sulfurimonas sp. TaxID=2022749 RepID=UPI002AAF843A|nr:hypothetical protein [Sulfurimonas sp.]